jgi:thiamine-phosphate pyrophosphorylase
MTPELTPAARRALAAAQRWAAHLGDAEVWPRHLLLALLDEEEGRAAVLLQMHGVLLAQARGLLAPESRQPLPAAEDEALDGPFAPNLQPVIYSARQVAIEVSGQTTIASEHLLAAILRDDEELRSSLADVGLDFDRLLATLQGEQGTPLTLDEPLELGEVTDAVDAARILDANANRAREALRVIEDFCRFSLNDALLSSELKKLRHELAEALADLSPMPLLEARDTQGDVGTGITTPSEETRHSLAAVVQANFKRTQEALRSLEEYGKLRSPDFGRRLEALRYRVYTLERTLLLGSTARQRLADARLYVLVNGSLCTASVEWTIQEAAAGGAQVFQLREKNLSDRELLERARNVRRWTRRAGVLFILNDRPDIARLAEADGVHIGQNELSVKDVRRIAGPHMLIGVSTHNGAQLRQAILDGASYVGVGPVFPSATKEFAELAGLDFVRQAAAETSLPAFAIGGIGPENVDQVVAAGLRRVAVSHAICTADEPRLVAAALRQAVNA